MGETDHRWHVPHGHDDQWGDHDDGEVLYRQQKNERTQIWQGDTRPLGHREQLALATGCQFWRRREHHQPPQSRGEFCCAAPHSLEFSEATSEQRKYWKETYG